MDEFEQFSCYEVIKEMLLIMRYDMFKRLIICSLFGIFLLCEICQNLKRFLLYLSIYSVIGGLIQLWVIYPIVESDPDKYIKIIMFIFVYYGMLIYVALYRIAQYILYIKLKNDNLI